MAALSDSAPRRLAYAEQNNHLYCQRGKVAQIEEAIAENEPQTYYAAYRTNDENAYFHIMQFPDQATEARHQQALYTLEFVEVLYPNCAVEPKFTDLELIEST